ncbi:MAG: hypothetical protein R3302_02095 [Sulfurimonadaceae bacterium]|nr:hypothetical protein [Sulfurimonadaceae bacterium]
MSSALDRLKDLTSKISGYEVARKENMKLLEALYEKLHIDEKVPRFHDLFDFKAINLSGISLTPETLGSVKEGKYVQVIGIIYDADSTVKNKNISLGYYGRADKIDPARKEEIIAFILRWRFEKSFMTLEHYHGMLSSLPKTNDA